MLRKIKRIGLSAGHNVNYPNGFDNGASYGKHREATYTKQTVKELMSMLEQAGYEVFDITPYNQKFKNSAEAHRWRANKAKELKVDLVIDIHLNAGGGTGPECYVYKLGNAATPIAEEIQHNLVRTLGLRDRGVKENKGFMILRMTSMPTILVEGCFIDSPKDMGVFTTTKYAQAIANGLGVDGIEEKEVDEMVYKTFNDLPSWGKDAIKKGLENGYIKGEGNNVLNMQESFFKSCVVMYRVGLFDTPYKNK